MRLPVMPLTGSDIMRAAGADRREAPRPLEEISNRRIDALSGGQYQLLCVWAALGSAMDLVLLDEPTNNLDPRTESLLIEILAAERGRRAVLLVSHERRFLDAACSRVLTLEAWREGRVMESFTAVLFDPLFRVALHHRVCCWPPFCRCWEPC